MAFDIGKARAETREMVIPYAGGEITCQLRPRLLTVRMIERTRRGEATAEEIVALWAKVLVAWDVVDGDQPVPITPDTLIDMDMELFQALGDAIGDALRPNLNSTDS